MIEAMKQALEALEMYINMDTHDEAHILEVDIAPKAITSLRQAIEQVENRQFNPDWDAMAVMVEEQQRMAKRIEELEQAEKQEPISDVTEAVTRTVIKVEKLLCEKLGKKWQASGMSIQTLADELAAPAAQHEWVDLTKDELFEIAGDGPDYFDWKVFGRDIEAKLKQKNGYAEEKNT